MKSNLLSFDWKLLFPVLILVIISLTTLFSINPSFFKSQLIYLIFSVFIFLFFSQIQYDFLKEHKIFIYISSIIAFVVVLIIGLESRGAIRWVDIFGIRIQFSEICKPFLAVVLAAFLSNNPDRSARSFILSIIFLVPVLLLIYLQPDLGNAAIYATVAFFTLLVFGFPLRWFAFSLIPIGVISPIFWHFLKDYQKQRFLTFLHPSHDPLGASYNAIQAVIAVGSGMFFGKGFSEGTQSALRFLPERQTDFIFATISESLGFIGSTIVIVVYIFLLYRIYKIYSSTQELFAKTFALCTFFILLTHVFVNIGMNLGILPVVGVTLPFISFGGSSLLSNFILLGILSSMYTEKNKTVLEIR